MQENRLLKKKKNLSEVQVCCGSEGQGLKLGAVSGPSENLGLALLKLKLFAAVYSNAELERGGKVESQNPFSLQSRICFGQVQGESSEGRDSTRQWGCCCHSYRSTFFFLEAVCMIQFVLLQVIYALLNGITVNEGAATACLSTFW